SNLTAATGGTPIQRSPAQAVLGSVWDGAASQYVAWGFQASGISGASPVISQMKLIASIGGVNGGAAFDFLNFYYNNSGTQGIVWGSTKAAVWQQDPRSGTAAASDMQFLGQAPTDGNGGGFYFQCRSGVGTNRSGGAYHVDLAGRNCTSRVSGACWLPHYRPSSTCFR